MPRTIAECPGCPPVRAWTTDMLGLVKGVESREKAGTPKVVETWGSPDASRSILVASYADRKSNPLLALGRNNGSIELLNPLNGEVLTTIKADETIVATDNLQEDHIMGLHLFSTKSVDIADRLGLLFTCSEKGKACLRSLPKKDATPDSEVASLSTWSVCKAGKVTCSKVDGSESHALFGGKGIELNLWDLQNNSKTWTAKSPPTNNLGIFTPTWFTAATFLNKEDHRKIIAGTNNHQVRLYDVIAQRRPVLSINFRESPIKAVAEDLDGHTIYIGTGSGDLASFDMRTGNLIGCYIGKCSGSIRSISRHAELPIIASCGLDSYLRFWDTKTRQLLAAVFLKQHLTNVVIDSYFSGNEPEVNNPHQSLPEKQIHDDNEADDTDRVEIIKTLEMNESNKIKKKKSKSKSKVYETSADLLDDLSEPKKKSKSKSKVYEISGDLLDDLSEPEDSAELLPPKRKKGSEKPSLKPKKSKKSPTS